MTFGAADGVGIAEELPMITSVRLPIAWMMISLAGPVAFSQDPIDLRRGAEVVDQGVADIDLLGVSQRVIDPGLAVPTGFDKVYRVPGRPGWLMRVSGGLYAMFPASIYTQFGAEVPPNTVFSIGPPAMASFAASTSETAASRLERSLEDPRIQPDEIAARPQPPDERFEGRGNIAEDGVYRRARLIAIVRSAIEAGRDHNDIRD